LVLALVNVVDHHRKSFLVISCNGAEKWIPVRYSEGPLFRWSAIPTNLNSRSLE